MVDAQRLKKTARPPSSAPRARDRDAWVWAIVLCIVTVIAYAPSLGGGFIWDDPDYVVNNPNLRDLGGLWSIWTNIFSLPQWYPLVHTTYWIEFHVYRAAGLGDPPGLWPMGYKLVNLALHIATALMLWRLLCRLAVPGALLAAFVFAVHPVHVESVAWITERKNALSGFFYMAAFLAYCHAGFGSRVPGFETEQPQAQPPVRDPKPETRTPAYMLALALFACALLSKTVTATFPAAVLVVIWWKNGRIGWRDIRPLIPFFILGAAMGSVTSYLERHHVGAVGAEWTHAPTLAGEIAARTLIAGRAVWFYLGKLIWPSGLAFMYEKWSVAPGVWWQWMYPIAAVVGMVALFLARRRIGRAPLAAALLFVGTLFPALGFFNVYPHRYAYVADHFQHLASIAVTTGICSVLAMLFARKRWPASPAGAPVALAVLLVGVLATLTFRQSRVYLSEESLWLDTERKSPNAWIVYTNLGKIFADKPGGVDRAIAYHEKALALAPNVPDTWYNVAAIRAQQQRYDEAKAAFARAIELAVKNRPGSAVQLDSLLGMGRIAMTHDNDPATAERYFLEARRVSPDYPLTHLYYAILLEHTGREVEAFEEYVTATERMPANFDAHYNLGNMLMRLRQYPQAADMFLKAVQIRPGSAEAWTNLGAATLQRGDRARAKLAFEEALRINPQLEPARRGLDAATR